MVELLIRRGAEVNLQNSDGYTALMTAAGCDQERVVELLLWHGAKINQQNSAPPPRLSRTESTCRGRRRVRAGRRGGGEGRGWRGWRGWREGSEAHVSVGEGDATSQRDGVAVRPCARHAISLCGRAPWTKTARQANAFGAGDPPPGAWATRATQVKSP